MSIGEELYLLMVATLFLGFMVLMITLCLLDWQIDRRVKQETVVRKRNTHSYPMNAKALSESEECRAVT